MKKKRYLKIGTTIVGLYILLVGFSGCKIKDSDSTDGNGNGNNEPVVYYISPDGDDANDGSASSPWYTIQYGISRLQAGYTLHIKAGRYHEAIYLNKDGTTDKKIHIRGDSFNTTILDGSSVTIDNVNSQNDLFFIENADYIEVSNLTFTRASRAGLRLSYSHHVEIHNCVFADNGKWGVFTDFSDHTTVQNCDAYGSGEEHGIYISNSSDHAVIRSNLVHHNYASGIQINADPSMGGDGISTECLIENNLVYENGRGGGAAVNLASVQDSVIQNNIIFNNYAGGIAAWDDGQGIQWGSKNLVIIHNTIYFRPVEGRWAISLKNGSTGAAIFNNIMAGGRRGGFEFNSNCLTGIEINYNTYYRFSSLSMVTDEDVREYTLVEWQLAGYDRQSFMDSPLNLFVDETHNDFHLNSNASAVNRGVDRGLGYDFEGDLRPQGTAPEIGADEVR